MKYKLPGSAMVVRADWRSLRLGLVVEKWKDPTSCRLQIGE